MSDKTKKAKKKITTETKAIVIIVIFLAIYAGTAAIQHKGVSEETFYWLTSTIAQVFATLIAFSFAIVSMIIGRIKTEQSMLLNNIDQLKLEELDMLCEKLNIRKPSVLLTRGDHTTAIIESGRLNSRNMMIRRIKTKRYTKNLSEYLQKALKESEGIDTSVLSTEQMESLDVCTLLFKETLESMPKDKKETRLEYRDILEHYRLYEPSSFLRAFAEYPKDSSEYRFFQYIKRHFYT